MSEKSSKNIAFRLYDTLVDSLDKVATENGTTRTAVVIQFINEGLERLEQGTTQVIRKQAVTKEEVEEIIKPLLNQQLQEILDRVQVLEDLTSNSNLPTAREIGEGLEDNLSVKTEGRAVAQVEQLQKDIQLCNQERLEALNRAGIAQMEVKMLQRKIRGIDDAIALLKNALADKFNQASFLKETIREVLKILND